MIVGIGIDTVEIERIRHSIDRFGDRILTKLFTDEEIRNSAAGQDPVRQFAVRFAAKEALSKAFATGNTGDFGWKKVEVLFSPAGVPSFQLSRLTGMKLSGATVHLSASATDKEVVATVVITSK
ncbi:MAG: holo-ACP synthase [Bacteroidota bacterium]